MPATPLREQQQPRLESGRRPGGSSSLSGTMSRLRCVGGVGGIGSGLLSASTTALYVSDTANNRVSVFCEIMGDLVFDDELQAVVVALQTGALGLGMPQRCLQVLQVQGLRHLLLHALNLL